MEHLRAQLPKALGVKEHEVPAILNQNGDGGAQPEAGDHQVNTVQ